MKTNIFTSRNRSLLLLIPILSVLATSCGSYQNSSYYDRDGIYGNSASASSEKAVVDNSSTHYKNYFNSLQEDSNQSDEFFTDVNQYNTTYSNDVIQNSNQTYADWGYNNYGSTSTSLYSNQWVNPMGFGFGNPYYGFGFNNPYYGFGFNSPFFGYGFNDPYFGFGFPNYGFGFPNYGFGFSNFGFGFPTYGNNNNTYSYNRSRRGSASNSNSISPNRYTQTPQANNRGRVLSTYNRSNLPNNSPLFNRSARVQTQINNYSRSSNNTNLKQNTQQNNNSSRRESSSPSRTYSPSPSNSSSSGSSYGGGSSSGGGGGRSSGGGGRTRG